MDKEATVVLRGVSTGYRQGKHVSMVSKGLDAQLHAGELTCLLGPNGAGKSTLLRSLAGFQRTLEGEVTVKGERLESLYGNRLARLVSVVLTNNSGIKNLTVEQVVALGRSPYTGFWGRLRVRDRRTVDRCLEWVGMDNFRSRRMETLSDGEKQKVMIAKAIAQETPVIFLDEPTAFLDYPSKVSMLLLLHRLAKALKKTVFLSTHDLEHALQVADQVWLLDKEHGLTTGMPEDLCGNGTVERYFNRPGLLFDASSGAFSIEHECAREILFEGDVDCLNFRLAERAFRRNAMLPIRSLGESRMEGLRTDVAIRIQGDGLYRLIDHGRVAVCTDKLEQILLVANATLIKNHIQSVRDAANMSAFD